MNHLEHHLNALKELSHQYGGDQQYVLLGGGNTSWKDREVMYVKASGHSLGTIELTGFVKMNLKSLNEVWDRHYSSVTAEREQEVLEDMMKARLPGETSRPSVEALLHSFIPFPYVVHLHPALVNGLTCGADGEALARDIFGDSMIWVESVNPGYILAKAVRDTALAHEKKTGQFPGIIFLQNHGVFVSGDTPGDIQELYQILMETLQRKVIKEPDLTPVIIDPVREERIRKGLKAGISTDIKVVGIMNRELVRYLLSPEDSRPIRSSYTPDHIVYSGHKPLWISLEALESPDPSGEIEKLVHEFIDSEGVPPKIVIAQQTGAFGIGSDVRHAEAAALVFLDTLQVAVYTESFGGPSFMDDEQIDFIRNWEVEHYRSKIHTNG